MKRRLIVRGFLLAAGIMVVLWGAGTARGRAQEGVCFSEGSSGVCTCTPTEVASTCVVQFTPTTTSWTMIFDANNKASYKFNKVNNAFLLEVDMIRSTQAQYAARSNFQGTVCNPSSFPDGMFCEFFRAHGESVPRLSWELPIEIVHVWNTPQIRGNPNRWMMLRAPCSEFLADTNVCNGTQVFSQNITKFVNPTATVAGDPAVGGDPDGISETIVVKCRGGDGDGDFRDKDGHRHHGHFHHNSCETNRGDVEDDDLDTGKNFHSTSVDSATFSSNAGGLALTMVGTGLHGGLPVSFTMIGVDYGNVTPGVFMLVLSDGYSVTGSLMNGSLIVD
jgi:hypothetical protein